VKRAPAWLLLLVVLAWYWPVALGARATSPTVDTHELPLATWLSDQLADWRIPEWNSLDGTGTPALAHSEIAPYYPPHQIAYRLFDPARAWTLLLVLHTLAAAVFGRLCARGFGLSPWASLLAGIVFAGQGFFMTHADRGWAAATACWLPLAAWAAWTWLQSGSTRALLGLAMILAVQATAGHFQIASMTVITLAGLALGQRLVVHSRWDQALLRSAGLVLAVLVAASLAAAQLVPSAELAGYGDSRGRDAAFLGSHSNPPWHLLAGQLAPTLFHSNPLWQASAWTPWHSSPSETLGYVGLLTLGLAALGLLAWKTDRRVRLWSLLLLAALGLSLGDNLPGFQALSLGQHLSGFAWFPAPGRWSVVAGLWWSLLAARGLESLHSHRLNTRCLSFCLAALLALAVTTFAVVWDASGTEAFFESPGEADFGSLLRHGYSETDWMTRSLTPGTELVRLLAHGLAIPLLVLTALVFLANSRWLFDQLIARPGLIVALVAIDLGITSLLVRPLDFTHDAYDPAATSPLLKQLSKNAGARIVSPLGRLPMAVGLTAFDNPALPDIERDWHTRAHPASHSLQGWPADWWPLPPPARRDSLGLMLAHAPARLAQNDLARMQWTGTRHLVSDSRTPAPQNRSLHSDGPKPDPGLARLQHGPRAARLEGWALYTHWSLETDRTASRAWFLPLAPDTAPKPDPRLERQPPPIRRGTLAAVKPILGLTDNGQTLDVVFECDRPGMLILADRFYPGWKATRSLNRTQPQETPIEMAWGEWRLVTVPSPGHWTIRFRFESASHKLGRLISVVTLVIWLALMAVPLWHRRGNKPGSLQTHTPA
jgi:hypothetical protein